MEPQLHLPSQNTGPDDRPVSQCFEGEAPAVRLTLAYKVGLGAVLVAMIALPLIYLALIAFTAWGVYLYATRGLNVFGGVRHVHFGFMFIYLIYLGPIVAGVILVCFMIKPIFSGFRVRHFSVPIGHVENPELFRLLGQLCRLLGAPIPSRVDVQLGVNASASFRAGFSSLFRNDIMLRIGLPLVAGLNCREFAGVLAHELGHFRQRAAMRFGYIIGAINGWFGRAVYQRDEFDDWLEEATNANGFTLLVFLLARIAIGLTRGILWLFMMCSHGLNSFMSRQMEFDADACSLVVAGTESFLTLHHKLSVLDFAERQLFAQLKGRVQPKMPDDLSTYVAVMAAQCAGETQGKVLRTATSRKSRWYDSHPSDATRDERAVKANLAGLIQDTRPATCLFGNFPKLSQGLTDLFYRSLRRPVRQAQIFHVEAPAAGVPDTAQEEAAIKTFFGGLGPVIKPLLLATDARLSVGNVAEKIEQLRKTKVFLEGANLLETREALKATDAGLIEALQQQVLLQAGLLSQEGDAPTNPEAVVWRITNDWNRLCRELDPFEQAARDRLMILLSLLRTPVVAGAVEETAQLQDEMVNLLHFYGRLGAVFPPLLALRKQFAKLQVLLPHRGQSSSDLLDAVLRNEAAEAGKLLDQIHQALGSTIYPFSHMKGNMSVVDYARAKEYDPDPLRMTSKETESHLQMLFALYFQTLGRLVAVAAKVESALENTASGRPAEARARPVVRIVKRGVS